MKRKWQEFLKVSRERGLRRTVVEVLRVLTTSVWHHEMVFVRGRIIEGRTSSESNEEVDDSAVECTILQAPFALEQVKQEIPASFRDSPDDLKKRLEEGCIVILARQQREGTQRHEVLGYLIAEKGSFSALGRKRKAGPDVLYGHYIEVLPEYRQKGIANLLVRAMEDYARSNGLRRYYALVSPKNPVARKILERHRHEWLGKVERVSILRGLYVWETPWEEIEKTLKKLGD
jgi:ribosomal protein S18 acetylase RimI-like enzyme